MSFLEKTEIKESQYELKYKKLEERISRMENKYLSDKLKICIKDVDSIYHSFSDNKDKDLSKYMYKLKDEAGNCKYIRTIDLRNKDLLQYKFTLIRNKLLEYRDTADTNIRFLDDFIEIINGLIKIKKFNLDRVDKMDSEEWW